MALGIFLQLLLLFPGVQTFATREAVSILEKSIDGDIHIGRIHLRPFNTLIIKDFYVIDNAPFDTKQPQDTLFKADYIATRFTTKGLLGKVTHYDQIREKIKGKRGVQLKRVKVSGGFFVYTIEPGTENSSSTNNLKRILHLGGKSQKGQNSNEIFNIRDVEIENFAFKMINYNKIKDIIAPKYNYGIKWSDFYAKDINLKGHNLRLIGKVMYGTAESLSFKEKSGFVCEHLSGNCKVGNGSTVIKNLKIRSGASTLNLPVYKMIYAEPNYFSDFPNKVILNGEIAESVLDIKTLSYFAPALKDNKLIFRAKGSASGPLNSLSIKNFKFIEHLTNVQGELNGKLTNVTGGRKMGTDFDVQNLSFTTESIDNFVQEWAPKAKMNLKKLSPNTIYNFSGKGRGKLNTLAVDGSIKSFYPNHEEIIANVKFQNLLDRKHDIIITGDIDTRNVNLRNLFNIKELGNCSLKSNLGITIAPKGPEIKIKSLKVSELELLDYKYKNIAAVGKYSQNEFDGRVICSDENLNFIFQGIFSLSDKTQNARYIFYANIGNADLHKLNLDKRGESSVSMSVNADFTRLAKQSDLIGNIEVKNIGLKNKGGHHDIGDIYIGSHSNNDVYRINLKADFADATYIGNRPISMLVNDLQALTIKKELPALSKRKIKHDSGVKYKIDMDFHDSRDLCSYLMPGLYIADSTSINLDINENEVAKGTLKSSRIAYQEDYLKGLNLYFDTKNNSLNTKLEATKLNFSAISLNNNLLNIYAKNDEVGVNYSFKNGEQENGEINLKALLSRNRHNFLNIDGYIMPSSFIIDNQKWELGQSKISFDKRHTYINDFKLSNKEQSIKINGGFSAKQKDTLEVNLSNVDMSTLNAIIKKNYNIQGIATGRALLISPLDKNPGLLANLYCADSKISGYKVGLLKLGSAWNEENNNFDILLHNIINGKQTIDASGTYAPKKNRINANINLDGFELGYISPIMESVFSKSEGKIYGNVRIDGTPKKLNIEGDNTEIHRGILEVDFTKVPYYIDGPFKINNDGIFFDGISIKDRFKGTGTIAGGILYKNLKDFSLDTRLNITNIEAINTQVSDNENFYGNVFASGKVSIVGPFNNLLLDVDAITTGNSDFNIPLANANAGSKNGLLTFTEIEKEVYIDPYEEMVKKKHKEKNQGNLKIKLKINATPDVECFIKMDGGGGNSLTARGNGQINLNINPSQNVFNIGGDYTINSGNYHFSALNLAERNFEIRDGSSIKFKGDIMDSDLDVDGTYVTKTSIATLIADTTSVAGRRLVECGIKITDKLKNPRLKLKIDIPDLDPTTKARVESALNTEDKIQKQFLSLLISNSFLPDEESGIVNNTNILYSNVAEIMSSQLNSILQKLDIPLDLGLTYQSTDRGTDIFDVAISTRLFNNRVIVNGTIGNRQYGQETEGQSHNGQDMVGDLDIAIKLDKAGKVRLNLFSHSADGYTNYLDNTQRNGIGITYQKEFNNFVTFLKNLFISKKKREQRKILELQQESKELKIINIEAKIGEENER